MFRTEVSAPVRGHEDEQGLSRLLPPAPIARREGRAEEDGRTGCRRRIGSG